MADASPGGTFNIKLVAGLVGAGVVAFAAFLLLAAYAGDGGDRSDGRAHARSIAATGYAGLVRLLDISGKESGFAVAESDLATENLVVVAPEPGRNDAALAKLLELRGPKATLIVLPKWHVMPDDNREGWVRAAGPIDNATVAAMIDGMVEAKVALVPAGPQLAGREFLAPMTYPSPRRVRTLAGDGLTPLLVTADGRAVLVRVGRTARYILADPDLLNNHGLRDPATARAALALLEELNATGAGAVTFDLTVNGLAVRPSGLKLLFEPPFLALTLALFVAALLAGWYGANRFGPERREARMIAFGKAALVDNAAALMRITNREHRAGPAYVALIRDAAALASAVPAGLPDDRVDAYLDGFVRPGLPPFTALAAQVDGAGDRVSLAAAARDLFQWKKDISQ